MKSNPIQIHVEPSQSNLLTRLRISGEALTQTPPPNFIELVACLASWGGVPIEFVLPVDCPDGRWLDVWINTFDSLPHADALIRFVLAGPPSMSSSFSTVEDQR